MTKPYITPEYLEREALQALADGLPHLFHCRESLYLPLRRLKRAGLVTLESLGRGNWVARRCDHAYLTPAK